MATRLTEQKVVVAEGRDDVHLVQVVATHLGLVGFQILSFDGVDNLRGYLKALPSVSGFDQVRSLGIVCDAEDSADARFQSVSNGLLAAGLPAPAAPLSATEGTPRVVVLINPHGAAHGSLEDVCVASAGADPAIPCVDAYLDCLRRAEIPGPRNTAKTRAHAFIASRDRPDVSLGIALQRSYFPVAHTAFDPVRRLLSML